MFYSLNAGKKASGHFLLTMYLNQFHLQMIQFCIFSLQNYPIQSRSYQIIKGKERVTFSAEDNTFI